MSDEIIKGSGSEVEPAEGLRRIFLGTEETGTFDEQEVAQLALRGVIVVPTGWGQNVYQLVEEPSSDDIMPHDD